MNNYDIENVIINCLIHDNDYSRKVIPFLKEKYFDTTNKILFKIIAKYISKYNKLPNNTVLKIELDNLTNINEKNYTDVLNNLTQIFETKKSLIKDNKWLLDNTEKWCKERALYLGIMESIDIIKDNKKNNTKKDGIPKLLQDALNISFNKSVGHDYFEDAEERFDLYSKKEIHIPFGIDILNKITLGGVTKKTLNLVLAATGVGKSLIMCDWASTNLAMGYNVLYITMEMAEEKIAARIDANLMDTKINSIPELGKKYFLNKIYNIKNKNTNGHLIVKEFPTGSAHAGHFRGLLSELELKKEFIPDIIYIDYLQICASSRRKMSSSSGGEMYGYIKSIAEEIRGLAMEFNIPIISAVQTNKGGYGNSDISLGEVAQSSGINDTADLMLGFMQTEAHQKQGIYFVKQLKNRYYDVNTFNKFNIGVDKSRMKLYDAEESDSKVLSEIFTNNPKNTKFVFN